MRIGIKLSCLKDSNGGRFYKYLFDKYIKIEPKFFTIGYEMKNWNAKKHIPVLAKAQDGNSIGVVGAGYILSVDLNGLKTPHQSVTIEQDSSFFNPSEQDMIDTIAGSSNFVAGYLYDADYLLVQSSESETLYNHRDDISSEILDSIKNTPYKIGMWGDKQYDTRFNPGNYITIANTHLMAAWKMWFGEPFFKMVPKERLLAFPHAVEVKELPTGQVYVHLFDKVEESHTPESRARQWEWQRWLDFDKLQEMYP